MSPGWRERRARRTGAVESVEQRTARELEEIAGERRERPQRPGAISESGVERPRALSRVLRLKTNVGDRERVGSALVGGALMAAGLRKRGPLAAALALTGGALVARGASGRCLAYAAMGRDTTGRTQPRKQHGPNAVLDASDAIRVEHAVTVDRPVELLWRYWRHLENLPRIMRHIEEVRDVDGTVSSWVARGPAGTRVRWRATIINEIPHELLAWKSLEGADIPNAGSVHFTPGADGTTIRVLLEYSPPAGRIGAMVASIFGEDPDVQVREDLENFRRAMESEAPPDARDRQVGVRRSNEGPGARERSRGQASAGRRDRVVPPAGELDSSPSEEGSP